MRLNLDKVTHPIHCYYPASGKKYFDRLRYGTIYHETINVVEHPVSEAGLVEDDGKFRIEATFLEHGVDNIGWRITEPDVRKYEDKLLLEKGIRGPLIKTLINQGYLDVNGVRVNIDDVSWIRKGDSIAIVIDTRYCQNAINIAKGAKILLCESTYQEEHKELAYKHFHLTAAEAATIAKQAGVKKLILTHFSARYLNVRDFENEARPIFSNVFAAEDLKTFPFEKD
jgi:ribonuclease Z